MKVQVVRRGPALALVGPLSAATVGDVRELLHDAVDHGDGDVVVDLSGVELLDATGLGVLVGAHRRAGRVGRRLVLRAVPPRIDRLLLATRLHRVLLVERPVPAA
jgi:anti-anti-sigma factor